MRPVKLLAGCLLCVELETGDIVVAGGRNYAIEKQIVHPEWKQVSDVENDVALVLLRVAVTGVEPALMFQDDEPVGSLVTFVGRGGFVQDGRLFVVGVSSWQDTRPTNRVQGVYGVIENYVRVSIHYEWITRTMSSASQTQTGSN